MSSGIERFGAGSGIRLILRCHTPVLQQPIWGYRQAGVSCGVLGGRVLQSNADNPQGQPSYRPQTHGKERLQTIQTTSIGEGHRARAISTTPNVSISVCVLYTLYKKHRCLH